VNKRYKQSVKSYSEESFEESLIVQHSNRKQRFIYGNVEQGKMSDYYCI